MPAEPVVDRAPSGMWPSVCVLAAGTIHGHLVNVDALVEWGGVGEFSLRLMVFMSLRPNKAISMSYSVIISNVQYDPNGHARVKGILNSLSVVDPYNVTTPRSRYIMFDIVVPVTRSHVWFVPQAVINNLAADPLFFSWARHAVAKEMREGLSVHIRHKRERRGETWTSCLGVDGDLTKAGETYLSWVDASDFKMLPTWHWRLRKACVPKTARGVGWRYADGTPVA